MSLQLMKDLLTRFLCAREEEVLGFFAKLPGSVRSKTGQWVYLPGKRPDRLLLVAHADTVHDDKVLNEICWIGDAAMRPEAAGKAGKGGYYSSAWSCLGADDRAGCAMWYNLFDGQHSVLITTGEERDCVGARAAVRDIGEELAKHQFAIQVDRRGDRQCVFYDVSTEAFRKWMIAQCTAFDYDRVSWSDEQGSSTDIKAICPEIELCGVNLSAGYWNEHQSDEMLLLGAWLHTRTVVRRILHEKSLPKFALPKPAKTHHTAGSWLTNQEWMVLKQLCSRSDLSRKQRKKLAKKVRKLFAMNNLSHHEAQVLLDCLFDHAPNTKDKEKFALPPLPSTSRQTGTNSRATDSNMSVIHSHYCDHGVLLSAWCAECEAVASDDRMVTGKRTEQRTHEGHPVVGTEVYCKECGVHLRKYGAEENTGNHAAICSMSGTENVECPECKIGKGMHFANCHRHRIQGFGEGKLCPQCQGQLPYHIAECPFRIPPLQRKEIVVCQHHWGKGQCGVDGCPHHLPKTPDPNDAVKSKCDCAAMYLNGRQYHQPRCPLYKVTVGVSSTHLLARVGEVHKPPVTVDQVIGPIQAPAIIKPDEVIVPVICSHWCFEKDCRKAWKHKKLKSGVCKMRYDSMCPSCCEGNRHLVEFYHKELADAEAAHIAALEAAGREDCTAVLEHIEAMAEVSRSKD